MIKVVCLLQVHLTNTHYKLTKELLLSRPIYTKSHRKHEANQVGFLGEVILLEFFKYNKIFVKEIFETTHDFQLFNGRAIEVKTKDRTVAPLINYDCSVPLYNISHQKVDYYFFVSLFRDKFNISNEIERFTKAWILGIATNKEMTEHGKIWRAGERDPENGTTFWTDCLNIKIEKLKSITEFIKYYRGRL